MPCFIASYSVGGVKKRYQMSTAGAVVRKVCRTQVHFKCRQSAITSCALILGLFGLIVFANAWCTLLWTG